ncbi:unnamed protein product [Onchocerca flexuosa]|uniref:Uncharacterized protein n=1 Tax=Onchocerca flexuosa TaxID=387005 RepID=A0A183HA52_9BILA|nr:unnamed protein product [Onchocerca flexuosa]
MECERPENLKHAPRFLTSQRKDREISGEKKAEPYCMISAIFSIQITMGIFGGNWRLCVMKRLAECLGNLAIANRRGRENENTSNKKILRKRKAKSMGRGYFEDSFILNSPPNKRCRSSRVLQQVKLVPTFNFGENLNKFGFEDEDENSENDSENVKSKMLHSSRISLPLATETSKVDFIGNRSRKNKSKKVNESMDKPIKRIDGLHLNDFKKPLIMLKRTEILAQARFIDDEYDTSGRESEDSDGDQDFDFSGISESFNKTDSDSEIDSNFCSEKNRKIKRCVAFQKFQESGFSINFSCFTILE